MQLHQPDIARQMEEFGASLIVVSFASRERLNGWVPYFRETFGVPEQILARTLFLSDPGREAYRAYGLGRHTVMEAYGPRIIWQYLRWALQGRPIRKSGQDTLQRGGDFVVGADGHLAFSHVGRDQSERPPVSEILAALRQQ